MAKGFKGERAGVQVGQVSTPAAKVAQHLQKVTEAVKMETITSLLLEENQLSEASGHAMPLTIVFVERKARCDEVRRNPAHVTLVMSGMQSVFQAPLVSPAQS